MIAGTKDRMNNITTYVHRRYIALKHLHISASSQGVMSQKTLRKLHSHCCGVHWLLFVEGVGKIRK